MVKINLIKIFILYSRKVRLKRSGQTAFLGHRNVILVYVVVKGHIFLRNNYEEPSIFTYPPRLENPV